MKSPIRNKTFIPITIGLLILAFFIQKCMTKNPVQQKIKELAVGGFDCTDYEVLSDFVIANKSERSFKKYLNRSGQLDTSMLNKSIDTVIGSDQFNSSLCFDTIQKENKVSFFLENSGSMDGYVRGITDYEAALADLVVETRHHYGEDNMAINFVNTAVYPVKMDSDISNFFSSLEPKKGSYVVGNQSVSELNELFRMILERTNKNDISIFISDCIYSLDKNRSTLQGLVFQQSLTKSVFLDKSKEFPLSALVLQMMSNFDGNYYDKDNRVTKLSNEQRPYYIWILGEDNAVRDFLTKKDLTEYKGFRNSYFFSSNANISLNAEVLGRTQTEGRFVIDRKDKSILKDINPVNNSFQFSLAVDFADYPDQKSVLDKTSFEITPGFEIVNIQAIPKNNQPKLLDGNDWNSVANKGYSHLITVRSQDQMFPSDFSLTFTNALPSWVESSNIDDDSDILQLLDKTFGLKYLFAGIQGAYETNGISAPHIKLTLNKK
jgi:hypothetical protein